MSSTLLTLTTCYVWLEHFHKEKSKGGCKHSWGPSPGTSNSSPIFSIAFTDLKRGPETLVDAPQVLNDVGLQGW